MTDIKIPVFDQVASAEEALDKLQERYDAATAAIRKALDAYLENRTIPTPEQRARDALAAMKGKP